MSEKSVDLKAEIAQVQRELVFFRDEILSMLIDCPIEDLFVVGMTDWLQSQVVTLTGELTDWKDAASQLSDLLPLGPLPANTPPLNREAFGKFLFQKPAPGYVVRGNRIVWRVRLFVSIEIALLCGNPFGEEPGEGDDPWDWYTARVDVAKRWLMTLPPESCTTANVLCEHLPFIADLDPAFARLALDRNTWRTVVQADATITNDLRAERLRTVDGFWFGYIQNNALLHVLGMLANNQFLAIRVFQDHPNLRGRYTHLMPHYLFAVLVEKVETLRGMAVESM